MDIEDSVVDISQDDLQHSSDEKRYTIWYIERHIER
jgi:hypothetical protein